MRGQCPPRIEITIGRVHFATQGTNVFHHAWSLLPSRRPHQGLATLFENVLLLVLQKQLSLSFLFTAPSISSFLSSPTELAQSSSFFFWKCRVEMPLCRRLFGSADRTADQRSSLYPRSGSCRDGIGCCCTGHVLTRMPR